MGAFGSVRELFVIRSYFINTVLEVYSRFRVGLFGIYLE